MIRKFCPDLIVNDSKFIEIKVNRYKSIIIWAQGKTERAPFSFLQWVRPLTLTLLSHPYLLLFLLIQQLRILHSQFF